MSPLCKGRRAPGAKLAMHHGLVHFCLIKAAFTPDPAPCCGLYVCMWYWWLWPFYFDGVDKQTDRQTNKITDATERPSHIGSTLYNQRGVGTNTVLKQYSKAGCRCHYQARSQPISFWGSGSRCRRCGDGKAPKALRTRRRRRR